LIEKQFNKVIFVGVKAKKFRGMRVFFKLRVFGDSFKTKKFRKPKNHQNVKIDVENVARKFMF